jgi:RimJ/RimL family protein N-acetyltransferase
MKNLTFLLYIKDMAQMSSKFEKDEEQYEVRFFDAKSKHDLEGLKKIIETPAVKKWMSNVHGMRHSDLKAWMNEQGKDNEFLFAIAEPDRDAGGIFGFIYIYPSELIRGCLEVSYAKGTTSPSGLTTPALREACKLVRKYVFAKRPNKRSAPKIIAEIEAKNEPSIKVVDRAGFEMTRAFDDENNGIWTLNWENLEG